ncbi:MAG: SCO1664 family protein [Acidimicrobiales bacterium]
MLALLAGGAVELKGRMPWSSNYTFLVELCGMGGASTLAVYKPGRGERPLWDFPGGLYRREAAAWVLSELLGWGLVPPTVVRDGPLGEGSVQRFVPADFSQHYFTLVEERAHHDALRAICAFDLLANNTDRKSGHCLLGEDGRIYAVDNGLCFHPDPKVRTVIWEFGGEPVPAPLLADVEQVLAALPAGLAPLLTPEEVEGVRRRSRHLLEWRSFPEPDPTGRGYPWPLV